MKKNNFKTLMMSKERIVIFLIEIFIHLNDKWIYIYLCI